MSRKKILAQQTMAENEKYQNYSEEKTLGVGRRGAGQLREEEIRNKWRLVGRSSSAGQG